MKIKYLWLVVVVISSGCHFENSKTTAIGGLLYDTCLLYNAWENIRVKYSVKNIRDSVWLDAVKKFEDNTFDSPVLLYFKEGPEELIGVDYGAVRYIYNPKIKDEVLDGLSPELSNAEQRRIRNRIQKILSEYQCDKGRKITLELMKEEDTSCP